MKRYLIEGIIVSMTIAGISGGVCMASDKPADMKPVVNTEAKVAAPAVEEKGADRGNRQHRPVSTSKAAGLKKTTDEPSSGKNKKSGEGKTSSADDWHGQ